MTRSQSSRLSRPFWVRLITWAFFIITLTGWLRFAQVIQQWSFLSSLDRIVPPIYLALTGILWGAIGTLNLYGLFTARSWIPWATPVSALMVTFSFWLDRLIVWLGGSTPSNLPFSAVFTIVCIFILFWGLSRPATRLYFTQAS